MKIRQVKITLTHQWFERGQRYKDDLNDHNISETYDILRCHYVTTA